jgi:CHASE3 domain sensor protein
MELAILERVRTVNATLQGLLRRTKEAVAGQRGFTVEEVRAIAMPVAEAAPIVSQARQLCATVPELDGELQNYAQNLTEMQTELERVRFALLARCAQIEAQHGHLQTVALWAATWRQTQ